MGVLINYSTPADVASRCVNVLGITEPNSIVADFSAGRGALLEAVFDAHSELDLHYIAMEIDPKFEEALQALEFINEVIIADFLKEDTDGVDVINAILINPTSFRGADMQHVMKAYEFLAPKGRLVALTSTDWVKGTLGEHSEFREWLDTVDAVSQRLPKNSIVVDKLELPTMMITIDKD